jgi:glucose-6-phosphate 1-epimerase
MPVSSAGEKQVNNALELQQNFGIANMVTVSEKAPGYPVIEVDNKYAKASIALHGAHVMAFQPKGEEPVLWLSRDAVYAEGKAIRGGIPICWPWFGGHPDGRLQAHGFVRNRFWQMESVEQLDNGFTRLVMSTGDDDISWALWDYPFRLGLTVVVGNELSIVLEMQNLGSSACTITAALHSYFNVADVSKIDILGLEGIKYIDQLRNDQRLIQNGPISFDGELDRIYCPTSADELLHDTRLKRKICLRKTGSRSTILWNPWIRKADSMGDFEKGGYRHMVCMETGNAADDIIELAPNISHSLGVVISVERD